ncbi:MAG: hypothetical protein DMG72_17410 [Acidobacteria bacterium]|nr:MAG: hypothetical protein DMG72_17410 [Acidobacteriota bacterium]
MSIRFRNYSMFTEKKYDRNWYEWCVFVDSDREVVDRINAVEYKLHPTFPDPVRLITQKENRFALFSSGWGGFLLRTRVIFEDGSEEAGGYYLALDKDSWPKEPAPSRFGSTVEQSVYAVLAEGKYRWRKLSTVASRTGLSTNSVQQVLGKLEVANLVRKLPYPSIDGQELWAATAAVGVMPRL